MLANIIIHRPAKQLHKPFTYEIPSTLGSIPIGTRVAVPLGKTGKEEGILVGYVPDNTEFPYTIKPIIGVLEETPWFTTEMLATAQKLSDYYVCTYAEALSLFTLQKKKLKSYERPRVQWLIVEDSFDIAAIPKRARKQLELATHLMTVKAASVDMLREKGFSLLVIRQVMKYDGIRVEARYVPTKTLFDCLDISQDIPLTAEQQNCYAPIKHAMDTDTYTPFLIHGVTGSGKTQLYMKLAQDCIKKDKIAVVLVPEIILTNQIVQRFVDMFGDEVVVFHSQLTVSERYNNWERIRRKDSHIIIGARSAVFAPTDDIGLIVVDEEHDTSYKQEDMVRYHARQVALWRGEYFQCPVVLGSATPSVESYYRSTETKEYTLLSMPHRVHAQPMPEVTLVDMKEELLHGNYNVLSDALDDLIQDTLRKQEQMIILLNRRGYSTFILCRDCGEAVQCPNCDVSLVYHKANDNLRCHYCDHQEPIPHVCPHCGSKKIRYFGSGTQKVEEYLQKRYPQARIARLDQDVASKKGEGKQVLADFASGAFDILLGTQMVAKGHDFSRVTGVGILTADSVLHIPVYSSAERTFDLLTQAAGRAGRGDKPGRVVIQTYNPLHYAIIKSKAHDYLGFYAEEIKCRKALAYPPVGQMIHIMIQQEKEEMAWSIANKVKQELTTNCEAQSLLPMIEISDPYEETVRRVRDLYRVSLMIRGKDLHCIKEWMKDSWMFTQEGMYIDVDPV